MAYITSRDSYDISKIGQDNDPSPNLCFSLRFSRFAHGDDVNLVYAAQVYQINLGKLDMVCAQLVKERKRNHFRSKSHD